MSCPQIVQSDKTPVEVGVRANDLLGGSFSSIKPLSGGVGSRHAASSDTLKTVAEVATESQFESAGASSARDGGSSVPLAQKLPDPWLFDSESLLREIDRIRETALAVPTNGDMNATHFGLQLVINAAWTLRENIRYILHLHREGQRAVRLKKGTDQQHQTIYVEKMLVNLAHNNLLITLWTGYPTL